jgi:hypothetical protein
MLADEEFWGETERTRDAVVAEFAKSDFHGIVLDAPKTVKLAGRGSLPIAGYFVRSLDDDRLLNQERQMVVVAVNLGTAEVLSGMVLQSGKIPAPQKEPPRNPSKGTQVSMFNFDLRQVLSMPWASGWYRMTVLLGRFISNTVVVELAAQGGAAMPASTGGSPRIERLRGAGPWPAWTTRWRASPAHLPGAGRAPKRCDRSALCGLGTKCRVRLGARAHEPPS